MIRIKRGRRQQKDWLQVILCLEMPTHTLCSTPIAICQSPCRSLPFRCRCGNPGSWGSGRGGASCCCWTPWRAETDSCLARPGAWAYSGFPVVPQCSAKRDAHTRQSPYGWRTRLQAAATAMAHAGGTRAAQAVSPPRQGWQVLRGEEAGEG